MCLLLGLVRFDSIRFDALCAVRLIWPDSLQFLCLWLCGGRRLANATIEMWKWNEMQRDVMETLNLRCFDWQMQWKPFRGSVVGHMNSFVASNIFILNLWLETVNILLKDEPERKKDEKWKIWKNESGQRLIGKKLEFEQRAFTLQSFYRYK